MLETMSFWRNISISIFKFSPSLCAIEVYGRNIFNFSKFTIVLIRKEKKNAHTTVNEKIKTEKSCLQSPLKG